MHSNLREVWVKSAHSNHKEVETNMLGFLDIIIVIIKNEVKGHHWSISVQLE